MDPGQELSYYRSLSQNKALRLSTPPPDFTSSVVFRGVTHIWSLIRDEVIKGLLPHLPPPMQTELCESLVEYLFDEKTKKPWQGLVGAMDGLRCLKHVVVGSGHLERITTWCAATQGPLCDPTPTVRTAAITLLTTLMSPHTLRQLVLSTLRTTTTTSTNKNDFQIESYLTLLMNVSSHVDEVESLEICECALQFVTHRASSVRQSVSNVACAVVSSHPTIEIAQSVLNTAAHMSVPSSSWEVDEGVLMVAEKVINTVLARKTDPRDFQGKHVDPHSLLSPSRFVISDRILELLFLHENSTQFELRRMVSAVVPIVAQCGLLWCPQELIRSLRGLEKGNCNVAANPQSLFRREVMWALAVFVNPLNAYYSPRLCHQVPTFQSVLHPSQDTVAMLMNVAYFGVMPTTQSIDFQKLPKNWYPLLLDVSRVSDRILTVSQRIELTTYCIDCVTTTTQKLPMYHILIFVESIAQTLRVLPECPQFLGYNSSDPLYSPPRLSDSEWTLVPNPTSMRYGTSHPVFVTSQIPYDVIEKLFLNKTSTTVLLGDPTVQSALHQLAPLTSYKGLELPVFKMLLFLGAVALRFAPAEHKSEYRKLWVNNISLRLEREHKPPPTGSQAKAPIKTGNSFDDDSDEEGDETSGDVQSSSASPLGTGTTMLVYDYVTLERLYGEFLEYVWKSEEKA